MNIRRHQLLVVTLIVSLGSASILNSAKAAVVSTEQYLSIVDREAELAKIDVMLARDDVRRKMLDLGVTHEQAMARVEALTDQEIMLLSDRLEELPAGEGLLGVALVAFLVILILELLGVIDIFKGV